MTDVVGCKHGKPWGHQATYPVQLLPRTVDLGMLRLASTPRVAGCPGANSSAENGDSPFPSDQPCIGSVNKVRLDGPGVESRAGGRKRKR